MIGPEGCRLVFVAITNVPSAHDGRTRRGRLWPAHPPSIDTSVVGWYQHLRCRSINTLRERTLESTPLRITELLSGCAGSAPSLPRKDSDRKEGASHVTAYGDWRRCHPPTGDVVTASEPLISLGLECVACRANHEQVSGTLLTLRFGLLRSPSLAETRVRNVSSDAVRVPYVL